MISIITPNLNGSKFLENCIQNKIKQKKCLEYIIVDGGSTDKSLEIIKKYNFVNLIIKKDKNMYEAINNGINISKHPIVTYINVDDNYCDNVLEYVLTIFNSNPDIDFIYGDTNILDNKGNLLYKYKCFDLINSFNMRCSIIPWLQPSFFFRRKVFEELGGFDTEYNLASDYDFFKKILTSNYKGMYVKKTLSSFMKRKDSLSYKFKEDLANEVIKINKNLNIKTNYFLELFLNITRKLYNYEKIIYQIKNIFVRKK